MYWSCHSVTVEFRTQPVMIRSPKYGVSIDLTRYLRLIGKHDTELSVSIPVPEAFLPTTEPSTGSRCRESRRSACFGDETLSADLTRQRVT